MVPVTLHGMASPHPGAIQPSVLLGPWNAVVLPPYDSMFRRAIAYARWLDILLKGYEASSVFSTVSIGFFPILFPHPSPLLLCILPLLPKDLLLSYLLGLGLVGYLLVR